MKLRIEGIVTEVEEGGNERRICDFRGTMTGGSLGLRSGSYGSLHQQLENSIVLPVQGTPSSGMRKTSKAFMLNSKEKIIHRIRIGATKMAGLVVLAAVSAIGILMLHSLLMGDEDSQGVYQELGESSSFWTSGGTVERREEVDNLVIDNFSSSNSVINSTKVLLAVYPPSQYVPQITLPDVHPCQDVNFPPPMLDRKRSGPRPCPVCYVPAELAAAYMPKTPSISPRVKNLTYIVEDFSLQNYSSGSRFGGHQTLPQRDVSYNIRESMAVHCGFAAGSKPSEHMEFGVRSSDLHEMEQCGGVVVASAVFGNYDTIHQPTNISDTSRREVCFFMFVDEETMASLMNSSALDSRNRVGLWRIVVARNLPSPDPRRTGKVPKLLLHRLFPSARYSIWIDGKLELMVDPFQILERYLWRTNSTFAISNHYRRHDVFVEALANKNAGKYSNASIDEQIEFYVREGLKPYSSAKLPIISDVPEGCVIIREHIPITNLFTCLWFNEVHRFTSRDQLSFSTVRDKIMAQVDWKINMFPDCERRNFVNQDYHIVDLKYKREKELAQQAARAQAKDLIIKQVKPPPPPLPPADVGTQQVVGKTPPKKTPAKRKDRRSSSRRHKTKYNTKEE